MVYAPKPEYATVAPPEAPGLTPPGPVMVTVKPGTVGTNGPPSVVLVVLDVLVEVLELVDVERLVEVLVLEEVVLLDDVLDDVLVLLDVLLLDDVLVELLVVVGGGAAVHAASPLLLPLQMSL